MSSSYDIIENFYRIAGVGFVWLSAILLTRGDSMNTVIPKSKFQPPGWVFGVVWTLIYIGYAIAWVYSTSVIKNKRPHRDREYFDFIFILGLLFNLLWSISIGLGIRDYIDKNSAFYISVFILIVLFIFSLYIIYLLDTEVKGLSGNRPLYWLSIGTFVLYAVWMAVATFLSLSGKGGW